MPDLLVLVDTLPNEEIVFKGSLESLPLYVNLSMQAYGLFVYLKAVGSRSWSIDNIKDNFTNGTTSIKSAIRELEEKELLYRIKAENGRMMYYTPYVSDTVSIVDGHVERVYPTRTIKYIGEE